MIAILKAQPAKPRVFLMQPTPLYRPNVYSMNQTVINFVLPRLLPTILSASAAEPQLIDLFNTLGGAGLTQPNITCDGCHPKHAGYVEMAQAIYNVLSKTIEEEGWPKFFPASAEQMCGCAPALLAPLFSLAGRFLPPPPFRLPYTHTHAGARPSPNLSGILSTRQIIWA